MRQIIDASAESLVPFVQASAEVGSVVHTDGWAGYLPLEASGYQHDVTILKGRIGQLLFGFLRQGRLHHSCCRWSTV